MSKKRKHRLGHISERNLREAEKIVTTRCMRAYENRKDLTSNEREIGEDACFLGMKNVIQLLAAREGIRDE